jgi:hypothetical protein
VHADQSFCAPSLAAVSQLWITFERDVRSGGLS